MYCLKLFSATDIIIEFFFPTELVDNDLTLITCYLLVVNAIDSSQLLVNLLENYNLEYIHVFS